MVIILLIEIPNLEIIFIDSSEKSRFIICASQLILLSLITGWRNEYFVEHENDNLYNSTEQPRFKKDFFPFVFSLTRF